MSLLDKSLVSHVASNLQLMLLILLAKSFSTECNGIIINESYTLHPSPSCTPTYKYSLIAASPTAPQRKLINKSITTPLDTKYSPTPLPITASQHQPTNKPIPEPSGQYTHHIKNKNKNENIIMMRPGLLSQYSIESDYLASMTMKTKSFHDYKTPFQIAVENELIEFLSSDRMGRIGHAIWVKRDLLRPEISENSFEVRATGLFSIVSELGNASAHDFYFTPMGFHFTETFLFFIYLGIFTLITVMARPTVYGLPNHRNNWCYFEAVLQLFMSAPPLAQSYITERHSFTVSEISHNMGFIFNKICKQNTYISSENIETLIVAFEQYDKQRVEKHTQAILNAENPESEPRALPQPIQFHAQRCADEFCRNCLFEALEYEGEKMCVQQDLTFHKCWNTWIDEITSWTRPIDGISLMDFQYQQTNVKELFPVIDASIPKPKEDNNIKMTRSRRKKKKKFTLKDCLLNSLKIDLEKPLKRDGVDATRVRCIRPLAEVLFININRYKYVGRKTDGKDETIVTCSQQLDLNCLLYDSTGNADGQNTKYSHYKPNDQFVYDLRGLLIHCGQFKGRG